MVEVRWSGNGAESEILRARKIWSGYLWGQLSNVGKAAVWWSTFGIMAVSILGSDIALCVTRGPFNLALLLSSPLAVAAAERMALETERPQSGYDRAGQAGYDRAGQAGYDRAGQAGYDRAGQAGYERAGQNGYERAGQNGHEVQNPGIERASLNSYEGQAESRLECCRKSGLTIRGLLIWTTVGRFLIWSVLIPVAYLLFKNNLALWLFFVFLMFFDGFEVAFSNSVDIDCGGLDNLSITYNLPITDFLRFRYTHIHQLIFDTSFILFTPPIMLIIFLINQKLMQQAAENQEVKDSSVLVLTLGVACVFGVLSLLSLYFYIKYIPVQKPDESCPPEGWDRRQLIDEDGEWPHNNEVHTLFDSYLEKMEDVVDGSLIVMSNNAFKWRLLILSLETALEDSMVSVILPIISINLITLFGPTNTRSRSDQPPTRRTTLRRLTPLSHHSAFNPIPSNNPTPPTHSDPSTDAGPAGPSTDAASPTTSTPSANPTWPTDPTSSTNPAPSNNPASSTNFHFRPVWGSNELEAVWDSDWGKVIVVNDVNPWNVTHRDAQAEAEPKMRELGPANPEIKIDPLMGLDPALSVNPRTLSVDPRLDGLTDGTFSPLPAEPGSIFHYFIGSHSDKTLAALISVIMIASGKLGGVLAGMYVSANGSVQQQTSKSLQRLFRLVFFSSLSLILLPWGYLGLERVLKDQVADSPTLTLTGHASLISDQPSIMLAGPDPQTMDPALQLAAMLRPAKFNYRRLNEVESDVDNRPFTNGRSADSISRESNDISHLKSDDPYTTILAYLAKAETEELMRNPWLRSTELEWDSHFPNRPFASYRNASFSDVRRLEGNDAHRKSLIPAWLTRPPAALSIGASLLGVFLFFVLSTAPKIGFAALIQGAFGQDEVQAAKVFGYVGMFVTVTDAAMITIINLIFHHIGTEKTALALIVVVTIYISHGLFEWIYGLRLVCGTEEYANGEYIVDTFQA